VHQLDPAATAAIAKYGVISLDAAMAKVNSINAAGKVKLANAWLTSMKPRMDLGEWQQAAQALERKASELDVQLAA